MRSRPTRAFSSLAVRNYRLYFAGQVVSVSGNWMQQIAVSWLVLRLTGSALALGLTTAAQQAPYLVVGPWGGLIADRIPTRRLLLATQAAHTATPLALWAFYESGSTRAWVVYVVVALRGIVNTVDNPARQSFVVELVGRDRLLNAVSLNASVTQVGRLLGPAVAAVLIAFVGLGPCFLLNAASFACMAGLLLLMRAAEFHPAAISTRSPRQLREGFGYVLRSPGLRIPLALMAVVGLLSFNFTVVLPAVARFTLHGNATTYALLMNFLAAGALVGAIVSGMRTAVSVRAIAVAAIAFGAALGVAALTSRLDLALVAMALVGATSVLFSASIQTVLQLTTVPEMRGRVLSLYQILYQGTTPLGAVLVGWLAEVSGARSGLVLGSVGAVAAGAAVLAVRARGGVGDTLALPHVDDRSGIARGDGTAAAHQAARTGRGAGGSNYRVPG